MFFSVPMSRVHAECFAGRLQAIPSADQPILNIAHMSEMQQPVELQSLTPTGQDSKAGNSLQHRNLLTMPTQDMDELTKYRAKQVNVVSISQGFDNSIACYGTLIPCFDRTRSLTMCL